MRKRLAAAHYRTGAGITLHVEGERIARIEAGVADEERRPGALYAAPGLVDLQINGICGHDFNAATVTSRDVLAAARALWREGVTSFCPTVITNDDASIAAAVRAIASACSADRLVAASVAGIHLEGPFISPVAGPRGAHDAAYIRAPDWDAFSRWQEAAEGRIRIVTLSPEWPEAVPFIRSCVRHGVIVSIGHTAAAPEQIQAAVAAGASMSTHLGNGAHLALPRHPNYIWEQLAHDELWAGFIGDGFHLPDPVIKVMLRAKGERALLVSDAVYLCGMPPGEYEAHIGGRVVLSPDGRLHMKNEPNLLAGSAQLLPWGIARLAQERLCSFAEAWEMASVRPAAAVGMDTRSGLAAGSPADIVLLERTAKGRIRIVETMKRGITVYRCEPGP